MADPHSRRRATRSARATKVRHRLVSLRDAVHGVRHGAEPWVCRADLEVPRKAYSVVRAPLRGDEGNALATAARPCGTGPPTTSVLAASFRGAKCISRSEGTRAGSRRGHMAWTCTGARAETHSTATVHLATQALPRGDAEAAWHAPAAALSQPRARRHPHASADHPRPALLSVHCPHASPAPCCFGSPSAA